ncbi:MAG TPA: hypothetical protein VIW29_09595 [Polyangiaceae bacterium]
MSEPKTLLLTETGVAQLPDGSSAINVGPIVRALAFLTEGRGDDRGTDELGSPLPDLMSLAFDVIESIILGGRKAEFFRRVKHELETQGEGAGDRSLALAKHAKRVQTRALPTALDEAVLTLNDMLGDLRGLSLPDERARELNQALEVFRAFGADRWVSATAQLLLALSALGTLDISAPQPKRARAAKNAPAAKAKAKANRKPKPKASRSPPPVAVPRQKARASVTASTRRKAKKRTSKKR